MRDMDLLEDAIMNGEGALPVLEAIDPKIGWLALPCLYFYTDARVDSAPYCGLVGKDLVLVKRLLATPRVTVVLVKRDGTHAMLPFERPVPAAERVCVVMLSIAHRRTQEPRTALW